MPSLNGTYIVFGKRRNPLMVLSFLIRFINKTPYSHCGVLITKNGDESFVYESTMPKSKMTPYKEWLKNYKLVECIWIPINEDPVEFLESKLGINYSFKQLFLIGLSMVFYPIFKYFKPSTVNGMKELVCAEFVALFLEAFTYYRFDKTNDFVSLIDVNRAARELNGYKFKLL